MLGAKPLAIWSFMMIILAVWLLAASDTRGFPWYTIGRRGKKHSVVAADEEIVLVEDNLNPRPKKTVQGSEGSTKASTSFPPSEKMKQSPESQKLKDPSTPPVVPPQLKVVNNNTNSSLSNTSSTSWSEWSLGLLGHEYNHQQGFLANLQSAILAFWVVSHVVVPVVFSSWIVAPAPLAYWYGASLRTGAAYQFVWVAVNMFLLNKSKVIDTSVQMLGYGKFDAQESYAHNTVVLIGGDPDHYVSKAFIAVFGLIHNPYVYLYSLYSSYHLLIFLFVRFSNLTKWQAQALPRPLFVVYFLWSLLGAVIQALARWNFGASADYILTLGNYIVGFLGSFAQLWLRWKLPSGDDEYAAAIRMAEVLKEELQCRTKSKSDVSLAAAYVRKLVGLEKSGKDYEGFFEKVNAGEIDAVNNRVVIRVQWKFVRGRAFHFLSNVLRGHNDVFLYIEVPNNDEKIGSDTQIRFKFHKATQVPWSSVSVCCFSGLAFEFPKGGSFKEAREYKSEAQTEESWSYVHHWFLGESGNKFDPNGAKNADSKQQQKNATADTTTTNTTAITNKINNNTNNTDIPAEEKVGSRHPTPARKNDSRPSSAPPVKKETRSSSVPRDQNDDIDNASVTCEGATNQLTKANLKKFNHETESNPSTAADSLSALSQSMAAMTSQIAEMFKEQKETQQKILALHQQQQKRNRSRSGNNRGGRGGRGGRGSSNTENGEQQQQAQTQDQSPARGRGGRGGRGNRGGGSRPQSPAGERSAAASSGNETKLVIFEELPDGTYRKKSGMAPRDVYVSAGPPDAVGEEEERILVARGKPCWVSSAVAALVYIARSLHITKTFDERISKFADASWAANEGAKFVVDTTLNRFADATADGPFDAAQAVGACLDTLTVKGKQKLNTMVRCGHSMPTHCKAFFILRFYKKLSTNASHWEPLLLDELTGKFNSLQEVPEPTDGLFRDYKVWVRKARPKQETKNDNPPDPQSPGDPNLNQGADGNDDGKNAEKNGHSTSSSSTSSSSSSSSTPANDSSSARENADTTSTQRASSAPTEGRPRSIRFLNTLEETDGRRFVPMEEGETPEMPSDSVANKSLADIFQCRRGLLTRLGGAVEGSRLPQTQDLEREGSLPQEQRCSEQLHETNSVGSSQGSPRSSRTNRIEQSTPEHAARRSHSLPLGNGLNGGSSSLAPNFPLQRVDEDGRGVLESGQVRFGDGHGSQALRINNLEERSQGLEDGCNGRSTNKSTCREGGRNLQVGESHSRQGSSNLHHAPLASLRSQGGRRSSSSEWGQGQRRWKSGGVHSGGEGGQSERGEVSRHLSLPTRMASGTPTVPRLEEGSKIPLPSVVGSVVRSSSLPTPRGSNSLLSLGSSRCSSSTGSSWNSRRSHHEDDGSQVLGNSPSLSQLGSSQRIISLQDSSSCEEGPQHAQKALSAATLRRTSSANTAFTTTHAFSHQPKVEHIFAGTSARHDILLPSNEEFKSFPAHIKMLDQRLDYVKLFELPSNNQEISDCARSAWDTYLIKPDIYEANLPVITSRGLYHADIEPMHSDQLYEAGIVEFVEDHEEVKGRCKVFKILELLKKRYRIIQHTIEHNLLIDDAPDVFFTRLDDRRRLVHAGPYVLNRDFKAYYHQFPLSPEVRKYFCFRTVTIDGKSRIARLCVAAMGQKHMVHVATATTDHLLAFDKKCTVDTQIDNVGFFGSAEDVCDAYYEFAARCKHAGATFNDHEEDATKLLETETDWMGMHLNMSDKTVSLTEKSVAKLELSWAGRQGWSWQGFAAHLGLLWWSAQILKIRPCNYYEVLRFASRVGLKMHETGDKQWHYPAEIPDYVWPELQAWTEVAHKNVPVFVPQRRDAEVLVLVDASSFGWGYVAWDTVTGETYSYGEKWKGGFAERNKANLERSTFTEPWGIINLKRHLLPQIKRSNPTFFIGSDNSCSVYVFTKRFSTRSYNLNYAVNTDEKEFGHLQVDYVHVPGSKNCMADENSRGHYVASRHGADAIKDSLRRLLGDSLGGLHKG